MELPQRKVVRDLSNLYEVIVKLRTELTQMLLDGYPINDPKVLKKSQELDKLVTAYYWYEYQDKKGKYEKAK